MHWLHDPFVANLFGAHIRIPDRLWLWELWWIMFAFAMGGIVFPVMMGGFREEVFDAANYKSSDQRRPRKDEKQKKKHKSA